MMVVQCCSACTAVLSPPSVPVSFCSEAQVTFGDFTYACTVTLEENILTVTPTDTHAEGLAIACDGSRVTFTQNGMATSFDKEHIDVTNPARALWEVLDSVNDGRADVVQEEGQYIYSGSCCAGSFTLSQKPDGSWQTLQLPSAAITVAFD